MNSLELLKKLTQTPGISGYERKIGKIIDEELKSTNSIRLSDKLGGISYKFEGKSEFPKIMFVGHQDEVGFIVANILSSGLLQMQNIGGWDPSTLKSSPVEVYNSHDECFQGIIGSIPIHLQNKADNPKLSIASMFVDIGAKSKEEVENNYKIRIGDPIVPISLFHHNNKSNTIISKAFDDRIGIAGIIELGTYLDKNPNHPNTVFCTGSVQEEVGTRGANTINAVVKPDIAIIIEGPPADDFPGNDAKAQTKLGQGLHLRLYDPTMIPKAELKNFVVDLAEELALDYQCTVRKGGGTDAKVIHLANQGIPAIVIGVPVRYAHSHNGIISLDDYEQMMKLAIGICEKLDAEKAKDILR